MAREVNEPPYDQNPWDDRQGRVRQIWADWFQRVSNHVNQSKPRAAGSVTPGVSPFTWQNNYSGVVQVLVSGGTVSALAISRDGTAFLPTGQTSGVMCLAQGDKLRVTYTAAPTINLLPL